MRYIFLYLLLINAASFVLMLVDKYKARRNLWRISESCLFTFAFLGGTLGSLAGMYLVRHKTRYRKFTVGMPIILILQIIIIIIIIGIYIYFSY